MYTWSFRENEVVFFLVLVYIYLLKYIDGGRESLFWVESVKYSKFGASVPLLKEPFIVNVTVSLYLTTDNYELVLIHFVVSTEGVNPYVRN